MLLRIISAFVLIPFVLALIFLAPFWLFGAVMSLVTLLAVWELSRLSARYSGRIYLSTYVLAALMPWAWRELPTLYLVFSVLIVLSLTVVRAREVREALPAVGANLLALCYVALPLALILELRFPNRLSFSVARPTFADAPWHLLLVMVIVWVADAAAYFTGKALGRRKIFPAISPHKTLEGYVGGLVFGAAAAVVFGRFFLPDSSVAVLSIIGIVLVAAGGLGDLFESLLKRGAGIKDSSNLIPGHGGVLDRIDSLLFAFPTYYVVLPLIPNWL